MAFVELSVTAHQSHNWGKVSILLFILFTERFMETQKLVFPSNMFRSVQSLSRVWLFVTPWTAARQASLSITSSQSLLRLIVLQVGDVIQPSHPLSSPCTPTSSLSQHQGLFQWVSSLHQMAKVLEIQLQHQPFQWIFKTDFLRMDWFDLLAAQRTLKTLLQHHRSKHRFFGTQLSL